MLEDRDYMRQPEYDEPRWRRRFGVRWSLTVYFLIAYAVVFFVEQILAGTKPQSVLYFYEHFALSNSGLSHGYVWQLVTYQFMHSGFLHLFFNGWAIYTFGLALEMELGRTRFAALMFSSGIIGGVFQALLAWLAPHYFPDNPVVGASACAFGLVAAYAVLFPQRELTMLVFFIIPVTISARVLLLVSAGLAVAALVMGMFVRTGNVANAAHLGGMVMGYFFVRLNWRAVRSRLTGTVRAVEPEKPRRPRLVVTDEPVTDSTAAVDAILDKISAQGIDSLTPRERETLEAARKKMSRS
ncbi:MAG: hypothetical protein RL616_2642 [Verrucomicrobiota bacterium]